MGPLKSDFREYRDLLATERLGGRKAFAARDSIRDRMLRVMSRTERPREAGGSLSLSIRRSAVPLEPIDIRVFKHLRESADDRDVGSVPAYWASIPYALQMMDERYVLAERASPKPLNGTSRLTCINEGVVRDFGEVPVPHPRLRGLLQEIPPELLALPWLPPTRPWWKLGGPFAEALERLGTHPSSKALVFSRYRAVPRALACAASYAAERHCFAEEAQRKRAGAAVAYEYRLEQGERPRAGRRRRPRPTFIFPKSSKHEMGLRTLLMFIPLPVLAKLGDPLPLAARSNGELTHDNALSSSMQKLRDRLGPPSRRREPVAAYRWAARLERTGDHWETYSQALMALATEASARSSSDQTTSGLLQAIRDFLSADDIAGGPTERELRDLAEFAISSPGNVLLRSTDRVFGEPLHEDERFRVIAEVSVYGLRPYLDASDLHLLLWRNRRAQHPASVRQAVWDGNLESALDEYLALQRGLGTDPKLSDLRLLETRALETLGEALNLGAVTLRVKDGDTTSGSKFGIRCHAALPFGMSQEIVSGDGVLRNDTLRKSFNSPFRPHLLVTTSIGQEGLDFHAYCNHVVHWDLPSNPVDLEQRDGRVNRYAGLAQRRALAQDSYALPSHKSPWIAIADAQREDVTGMSPWWTHPGAGIRRTMFTPPFSRIEPELERLLRSLSLYRMALGQSDQEALVSALHRRLSEPGVDREALMKWLEKARIDLSPKA